MNTDVLNKINFTLVSLFIFFLTVPIYKNGTSLILILLLISTLFFSIKTRNIRFNKKYLFLIIPLIVYSFGLINTINIDYGLSFFIRNISFFFIPLIFSNFNFKYNNLEWFKLFFIIGAIISSIISSFYFFYYFNIGEKLYKIISIDYFHTTYLGMIFCIALIFSIEKFIQKKGTIYLICSLILLFSTIAVSARIILISLFAILIYYINKYIKSGIKKLLGLILITSLILITIKFVPSINRKFSQLTKIENLKYDKNNYKSVSLRLGKIQATVQVIEENMVLGSGTGDLYEFLNAEYRKMGFTMGYKNNYNPHNQYLSFLARSGIILGSFLIYFIYLHPFFLSKKSSYKAIIPIMLVFGLTSLTESILDVQKGIYMYTFLICLILYSDESYNYN